MAQDTDGFSGADLQALVYNSHLDVVHESISSDAVETSKKSPADGGALQFTTFGGSSAEHTGVISKADEAALTKRVSSDDALKTIVVLILLFFAVGNHYVWASQVWKDNQELFVRATP